MCGGKHSHAECEHMLADQLKHFGLDSHWIQHDTISSASHFLHSVGWKTIDVNVSGSDSATMEGSAYSGKEVSGSSFC